MSERQYVEVVLDSKEMESSLKDLEKTVEKAQESMAQNAESMVSVLSELGSSMEEIVAEPMTQLSSSNEHLLASLSSLATFSNAAKGAFAALSAGAKVAEPGIASFGATMNSAFGIVGMIITGISALVTLFSNLGGESSASAKQIEEDTEKIVAANEEIRDATSEVEMEYDKTAAGIEVQSERLTSLVDEYYQLKESGSQSAETQNRMRNIVKSLTGEIDSLGVYVDKTTGQFTDNEKEIRQCIDAQQSFNKAMAATDYKTDMSKQYLDALTQQKVVEEQIIQNGDKIKSNNDKIKQYENEEQKARTDRANYYNLLIEQGLSYQEAAEKSNATYNDQIKGAQDGAAKLRDENNALNDSTKELKDSQGELEDQVASLKEAEEAAAEIEAELNTEALQGYADRLDSIGELGEVHDAYTETEIENIETLLASQNNLSEAERQKLEATVQRYDAENAMMEAQIEATKESYNTISSLQAQELEQRILNGEELSELEEAQLERYKEIQDERVSIATNGNERINLSDQISLEQRTANMEHNNEVLKGFDDNMDHLRKVEDETLQAYLNSIDIYSEEGMAIVAQLANGISTTGEMSDEVKNFLAAWAESMTTSTEEVGGAVEDAAEDVGSTMGEEMNPQEASDTTKTYFDAAINMVTVKGAELKNKMKDVMQDAMDAADRKASPGNWRSIGQSLMSGIIGGVRSKRDDLTGAIKDCINEAVREAKKAAGINSPSRLFAREIGLPISEGMALGVTQGAGMLERALDDTIRNTALGVDPVVFRDISSAFAGAAAGTGSRTVNSNITFQVNGDITAVQRRRIVQDVRRELGRLVN